MHDALVARFGFALAAWLAACGPAGSSAPRPGQTAGQDAAPAVDGPGTPDDAGLPAGDAADGAADGATVSCHEEHFAPEPTARADIMILMDMSHSMAAGSPSKYEQTATAVTSALTALEQGGADLEWGLLLFPHGGSCDVDGVQVPIGPGQAPAITAAIQAAQPEGNTPLVKAVRLATASYGSLADGRAHYLLVATDGQPNCGSSERWCLQDADCDPGETCSGIPFLVGTCEGPDPADQATLALGEALAAGVRTYVVGLDIGAEDQETLNRLAAAGGTARAGSPQYYPAADQATLTQALTTIAGQVIACSFALDQPPADATLVSVTVGGQPIARDPSHTNGWDLVDNGTRLELYGPTCDALRVHPQPVAVDVACPPVS
jgi:hypothetical protein